MVIENLNDYNRVSKVKEYFNGMKCGNDLIILFQNT